MEMKLIRHRFTPWGVDGYIEINQKHVCDTVEHPQFLLPLGEYEVYFLKEDKHLSKPLIKGNSERTRKRHPRFMPGNGPFWTKDGSIVVGEHAIAGVLIHSEKCFLRLSDRLKKCYKREEEITLTIVEKEP